MVGAAAPYARKSETPELIVTGWSCFCSFALVVVIGSVTLIYAIAHYGGMHQPGFKEAAAIRTELPAAGKPGFFMEIGHASKNVEESHRGKHLEKKGWSGICAAPFPSDFSGRTCKVIALAVSGLSGEKMLARDCSKERLLMGSFDAEDPCPAAETNTLGISDLLSVSTPPPIIDYVSLDASGKEAEILRNFPFQDYCVKAWAVRHDRNGTMMARIRQALEVAQGCRMHDIRGEFWARCPCGKHAAQRKVFQASAASVVQTRSQTSVVLDEDGSASEAAKN
jgi:hypothetical protein